MIERAGCYVHIPFCVRKCAYCDFNSYSGYTDGLIQRYVAALECEIRDLANRTSLLPDPVPPELGARGMTWFAPPIDTIFFGGGTPTAIPSEDLVRLLNAVRESYSVDASAEITTEANPGTADISGLSILRAGGFNRISFGVQSFDAGLLKTLDRIHSAEEAVTAVRAARSAGFDSLSIDLMFGLPRQTISQWRETLDKALTLETDHISLYSLIVEEGTGFYTLRRKGRLPLPDDDTSAEMFQMAIDAALSAGYEQYEVSNFAKPGKACLHNIHYWNNDPYYGFGCGAVSYLNGERATRIKSPTKYCEAVETGKDLLFEVEGADQTLAMGDTMILGLRMTRDGVDCARFHARYGVDPRERYADIIGRHTQNGLLEQIGERLRLTPHGVFLANDVMLDFV